MIFRETRTVLLNAKVASRARSISTTIAQDVDVLVGGILYSTPVHGCTIGAMVDYNGAPSFLTASHCTSVMFGLDGVVATQAFGTSRRVGAETRDPGGYQCGIRVCRGSDAAIFGLDAGVLSSRGLIARTTYRSGPCGSVCASGSLYWDMLDPYFYVTDVASATT